MMSDDVQDWRAVLDGRREWAIVNADCLDVLRELPAGSVDAVVTDPPYGIDHPTNYAGRQRASLAPCRDYPRVHGDDKPFDPAAVLALGVPTVLWGANYYADRLPSSSGWLVWDKQRPHTLDQATAELAWTNFVKGARVFRYLWNGMIRAGNDDLEHPTQKPVALMAWCLSLRWMPPGLVLDPYTGSGTTGVACIQTGRRFIGVEIDPTYHAIAVERLTKAAAARQPALPLTMEA